MHLANKRAGTAPTVPTLISNRPGQAAHINPTPMEVTMVTDIMPGTVPTIRVDNVGEAR